MKRIVSFLIISVLCIAQVQISVADGFFTIKNNSDYTLEVTTYIHSVGSGQESESKRFSLQKDESHNVPNTVGDKYIGKFYVDAIKWHTTNARESLQGWLRRGGIIKDGSVITITNNDLK